MRKNTGMVNWCLRRVFQATCRIDVNEIQKIPRSGPLILVGNHVNFLETPVLMPHINNPRLTGLAKKESWDNPLFHFLFNQWEIIPIDRDEVDREAFRQAIHTLAQGNILAVYPEGTRSKDGCLLKGRPGVVALAYRSHAPILPLAFYGHETFWGNLKRLRRTDFHVVIGQPFRLDTRGAALSRDVRETATDEIMYKIAELLPERYRGAYRDVSLIKYQYLAGI